MSSPDPRGSEAFVRSQEAQWVRWEKDYKWWMRIHWGIALLGIICSGLAVPSLEIFAPYRSLLSAVGGMSTLVRV
jgi:hypothetical protein